MPSTFERAPTGQLTGESELCDIVQAFPAGIVHSFGYGSGVFSQQLPLTASQPMIDLILVIQDAREWHEANLRQHPHHYSSTCRVLGAGFCASLQRNYGARVFFHALVDAPNDKSKRLIKYGVVQVQDLKEDLRDWNYLYLAGRMHKPIVDVVQSDELSELQQENNLPSALAASLLLSSSSSEQYMSIPLEKAYERIANLSYAGDIRMQVSAEDPDKIHKLVHSPGQLDRFHKLYRGPLQRLERKGLVNISGSLLEWDSTASGQKALWSLLPPRLASMGESNETIMSCIELEKSLASIVAPAARYQSMKGILTAGLVKSMRYAAAKFAKGAFRNF